MTEILRVSEWVGVELDWAVAVLAFAMGDSFLGHRRLFRIISHRVTCDVTHGG